MFYSGVPLSVIVSPYCSLKPHPLPPEPGVAAMWPYAAHPGGDPLHARPVEEGASHPPSVQAVHTRVPVHYGELGVCMGREGKDLRALFHPLSPPHLALLFITLLLLHLLPPAPPISIPPLFHQSIFSPFHLFTVEEGRSGGDQWTEREGGSSEEYGRGGTGRR